MVLFLVYYIIDNRYAQRLVSYLRHVKPFFQFSTDI